MPKKLAPTCNTFGKIIAYFTLIIISSVLAMFICIILPESAS
jgi:hypothetical protein